MASVVQAEAGTTLPTFAKLAWLAHADELHLAVLKSSCSWFSDRHSGNYSQQIGADRFAVQHCNLGCFIWERLVSTSKPDDAKVVKIVESDGPQSIRSCGRKVALLVS